MTIDGDLLTKISLDVANRVPVEQSQLAYTAPMLRVRERFEAELAELPPGHFIDIPNELPDLRTPMPRYARRKK